MKHILEELLSRLDWPDRFGETSYDHQSYFASDLAREALIFGLPF